MIGTLTRLFGRAEPSLSEAGAKDASAFALLHAASFRRGWSDGEFERLLFDSNVLAHRAMTGRKLLGLIISRAAADEAEILSVAVAASARGRGIARKLLALHLGRLAAHGISAVFLEVDEDNTPARRLYRRAGFHEVGRREGYYAAGGANASAALILRRNLG